MPTVATRALAVTIALSAAVGLSACTGSSGSHPSSSSTAGHSSAKARATGTPVDPKTIARKLRTGLDPATSAHLAITTKLSGQTLTGDGDVALSGGRITAADISQQLPTGLGTIRVVEAGGTDYAKLPAGLDTSGKPWSKLSTSSSNPVLSQVAQIVVPLLAVASPDTLVAFAGAAQSAQRLGRGQRGGVAATEYHLVVDPGKLPSTVPADVRSASGTIPVDLWLDSAGRPVQVTGTLPISGQRVTPTITLSDYDEHVSISPPPAGEVSSQ